MIEYRILKNYHSSVLLADDVMDHIADGWTPIGGVALTMDKGGDLVWAQALVK